MFRRKPDMPDEVHPAWWAFLDCAEVIEAGRRVLLGTLPTGRVEPAPIAVGTDAVRRSIADARTWMSDWRIDEVGPEWQACNDSLDQALEAAGELDEVAGTTDELEELLEAVGGVVEPLDTFADAERAFRRQWRPPTRRPDDVTGPGPSEEGVA